MLSRLVAQRICETILQVNLKIQGVPDTLKCETGKKEVWTPKVVLISELRESKVTYGSEDSGDLSLRDACLGKPRSMNKRSFISSNVDSRWKGDNGKGLKGGHKEGTQKQKVRKLHCAALMHIRHLQKYEYIPENVRKSNSSVEFMEIEIGTIIDEVVDGWHQWKVARMNSKPSSSTSTITEYFGTFFLWILIIRGWWVTVQNCARRKRISIIGASNLPSLQWNITSQVHRIRTTLKRRSDLLACTGKPSPSRCGLNPGVLEKQQQRRQQQSCVKTSEDKVHLHKRQESFERTEFGLWFLDDRRGEDILRDSHLQVCLLRHHDRRHSEEARATYWDITSNIENGRVYKIPKFYWKEDSRVRIGRIAFTTEASNL